MISYSKYKDEWTVLVRQEEAKEGDTVTVTKKDGTSKQEVLGKMLSDDKGAKRFEIVQRTAKPRRNRYWRPCGYPGCNPSYCDECEGEGAGGGWRR